MLLWPSLHAGAFFLLWWLVTLNGYAADTEYGPQITFLKADPTTNRLGVFRIQDHLPQRPLSPPAQLRHMAQ